MKTDNINSQLAASITKLINQIREDQLEEILSVIADVEQRELSLQEKNFVDALMCMHEAEEFVIDPSHILGNISTKHGEIAERLEVAINNAESRIHGGTNVSTADPSVVGRTVNAPADYILNGQKVQSKFINGDLNTLKHIKAHFLKYEDIGFASGDGSYYHIPNDTYDHLIKILENGELEGRHSRSIRAIMDQIKEIEELSGQNFTDIVKPAHANYSDVQLEKIQDTINKYKNSLSIENEAIKGEIVENSSKDQASAIAAHQPSIAEGLQTAGYAAAISAGIGLLFAIYKKHSEGIEITNFTEKDWEDVLVASGKNAIKGAISGGAIYALTNCANMSAPFAGAIISATFGVISLVYAYQKNEISKEQLIVEGEIVCIEAALIAAGATAGQFAIPVPVLGAVVGTLATTLLVELLEQLYGEEVREVLNTINHKVADTAEAISADAKIFLDESYRVIAKYGSILALACDDGLEINIHYSLRDKASKNKEHNAEKELEKNPEKAFN